MTELEPRSSRELIANAARRGTLSPTSSAALQRSKIDQQVQEALEDSFTIDSPGAVLLITMMPDDSGSMTGPQTGKPSTKQASVIAGHSELLSALSASRERDHILLQTRCLNGSMPNPFSPLTECAMLSMENYPCTHGTPLYEQTLVLLGTVMAKAEELTEAGANVRTATLVMSDGESTEANKEELAIEVASVVRDMKQVGDHIVAGMSFTARSTDKFSQPFLAMGIDRSHIFSASSREDILKFFGVFKERAIAKLTGGAPTSQVFEL